MWLIRQASGSRELRTSSWDPSCRLCSVRRPNGLCVHTDQKGRHGFTKKKRLGGGLHDCEERGRGEDEGDDMRILPVEEERAWTHAAREITRVRRTLHTHRDNWKALSGVPTSSRSSHEHLSLCRALHLLTEWAVDRARPRRTNGCTYWNGAEDFLGVDGSSSGIVVDPRRANFVAARQEAWAKIVESSREAREGSALHPRRDRHAPAPAGVTDGKDVGNDTEESGKGGRHPEEVAAARQWGLSLGEPTVI